MMVVEASKSDMMGSVGEKVLESMQLKLNGSQQTVSDLRLRFPLLLLKDW